MDRLYWLVRDLRTILELDPDNGHALNALGYTLTDRTDRHQEALGYIERAYALLPNDAAVVDSMGWVHYRLGNLDKALTYLRRAYDLDPDPEIGAHLSEVLWYLGKRDEARTLWQRAVEASPDSEHLLGIKSLLEL
ncbi:MAG: tetratricopeptide repeat protein [Candidatus Competibacterales bacterium]